MADNLRSTHQLNNKMKPKTEIRNPKYKYSYKILQMNINNLQYTIIYNNLKTIKCDKKGRNPKSEIRNITI